MHTIQPTDALLVIDLQNDFCPGGALGIAGGDEIVPVVNALARAFPHVLLTQDWHPPAHISFASAHRGAKPYQTIAAPYGPQTLWPDHCVQNTRGAEFHPALDIPHAELILRKGFRAQHRLLLRVSGERPLHAHRPGRLPARTRPDASLPLRAGLRLLRALLRHRRHRARLRVPCHRGRHPPRQAARQHRRHRQAFAEAGIQRILSEEILGS